MIRLMCAPTYFDIEYSINPWMNVAVKVNKALAFEQWHHFIDALKELGDTVELIEPMPGLPDMTFAGDGGLVVERTFIPSNFRNKERQGESAHYTHWFEQRGFNIVRMPDDVFFEGLGDVVFHEKRAIVGHGRRSDARAIEHLKRIVPDLHILGDLYIRDDRYFHLAMALAFIDADTLLYYPEAFDEGGVKRLPLMVKHPIALGDKDANEYFACNNLVIGDTVLMDNCTAGLRGALAECGYRVNACDMSEFKKSGGSLRCLVLSFIEQA
jgi:N-dimethylarginine dimethylaminohydrolase